MDQRWGRDEAASIRVNATVSMYLPGIKETDRLRDLSEATGRYRARRLSMSTGGAGSMTTSTEWENVMSPDNVMQMPIGTGLLLYRGLKAAHVRLTPWWKRTDAGATRTGLAEAERLTGRRLPEERTEPHPGETALVDEKEEEVTA